MSTTRKAAAKRRPKATDRGFNAGRTPANKEQKLPVEILTPEELRALMGACSSRYPSGVRNAAMLAVFAGAGVRLAEALALMPRDVDLDAGTLTVRHGKGDKRRVASIADQLAPVLARWMDRRKALGLTGRHPVFCTISDTPDSSPGRPLSQGYVRTLLPRLGRRAGIEKRVHPHGLRHYYAARHREAGTDIGAISKLLGHTSIATTARYLDHINPREALQAGRALVIC